MKNFFKKYVKFNLTTVNIVICAISMILNICAGNYWDIVGWLSAFCAWIVVAFTENWNDELLDERFNLEHKLTDLYIKNIGLNHNKNFNEKDIEFLKKCSLEEITQLKNTVLKMQEENERLQKLLNELKK